ncbi:MAG: hypothetical protein MJZ19_11185 [Paludibacteraceae bacterium]|nr:hypothetical protein [Paludibacteraceae bacterium]
MKQIVRLTESDVHRIVEHVITEAIDEITGNQRRVIARYGKDSAESIISGNSTLSNGRNVSKTTKQIAQMDEQSLYMMLTPFKSIPFTIALNYQGIDCIMEFWVENLSQINTEFTIQGTLFMRNGARIIGSLVYDVANDRKFIKIKGQRHLYEFTVCAKSNINWDKLVNNLKNSLIQ